MGPRALEALVQLAGSEPVRSVVGADSADDALGAKVGILGLHLFSSSIDNSIDDLTCTMYHLCLEKIIVHTDKSQFKKLMACILIFS